MNALYGRDELLRRSRAALERALGGHGQLLLFTGEPGIGKSSVIERLARDAAERGAAVAWGRSWEAGGAPAYWPWTQVFRSLGADADPFAGATDDLAHGKAEARFALFDRAVRGLLAKAAQTPLTLVLDDLHAADAPSLLLLLLLSRELRRAPLLILGAYRDAEVPSQSELAPLLAKLAREAQVEPLQRLRPEHIIAWLRELAPDASDARADELFRVTEGQPLFVVEALRLGADADGRSSWVHGPRALLDERLSQLSDTTRQVLEVAAVLGREFELEAVSLLSAHSPDAVHEALREASALSIAVALGDPGRARFSHVLLRDRLYHELAPSRRSELHVAIGWRAAERGDAQLAAHHLFESGGAVPPAQIAEVALEAADAALARVAFEDARRLSQRVLDGTAGAQLPEALRSALQSVAGEASIRLGDSAHGQALCVAAAESAERAQEPLLLARAALAYAAELATGSLDPQMIDLLRRALDRLPPGDSALRARLLARLCAALTPPGDPADAPRIIGLMRDAIDMSRRLGDRHALLYVLQFAATVGLLVPEQERFGLLEESLSLARSLRQPLVLLRVLPPYITALIALGGVREASALLPEYSALIGESRLPGPRIRYLAVCSLLALLRGDRDEVARLEREAHELLRQDVTPGAEFVWTTHKVSAAELEDQPVQLAGYAQALAMRSNAMPSARQHYGWFLASVGRVDEAREMLRALELRLGVEWLLWEPNCAARTCVVLGDVELGEMLYPHAVRAADRAYWTLGPGAILGPASRALGELALLLGRVSEAVAHFERAVADAERVSAWLAERCRQRLESARARLAAPAMPAAPPSRAAPAFALAREGDVWAVTTAGGVTHRLKHGKGLQYLQQLIERPGQPVHVLELAGIEHWTGDAGPVLDSQAKAAYAERLATLRDEIAEAEHFGDPLRAGRASQEIQALAEQLASAVGLGGRDRRAASDVERARINVQRRLKDAIDRIEAVDPALGKYLAAAVKTGALCMYQPL